MVSLNNNDTFNPQTQSQQSPNKFFERVSNGPRRIGMFGKGAVVVGSNITSPEFAKVDRNSDHCPPWVLLELLEALKCWPIGLHPMRSDGEPPTSTPFASPMQCKEGLALEGAEVGNLECRRPFTKHPNHILKQLQWGSQWGCDVSSSRASPPPPPTPCPCPLVEHSQKVKSCFNNSIGPLGYMSHVDKLQFHFLKLKVRNNIGIIGI
jgi:hypothetical protein